MASCEKCWRDAHYGPSGSVAEEYFRLIELRTGDKACTPEEQAGPDSGWCEKCKRRTIHQYVHACVICGNVDVVFNG